MKNKLNTILQWIGFTLVALLCVTADSIATWGLAILTVLAIIVAGHDYDLRKAQRLSDTPIGDQLAKEMGIEVRDFIVRDGKIEDVA